MKKLLFVFTAILAFSFASQAQSTDANAPEITFEKTTFDFGDIKQGQVVNASFKFKNTGKSPLILQNVQTSCGCTVPQWPKDPIGAGKTSEMNATFNSAGKMGQQNKVITVFSNGKNSQTQVSIICNVLPADPTPAVAPK